MRYSSRRRGFSLVELLIVIVVIGVLSSMMIFSSSESISSAKASNIISNLRSLKNAAFAMYINHPESFDTTAPSNPTKDQLALAMGESNIEGYPKDLDINKYQKNQIGVYSPSYTSDVSGDTEVIVCAPGISKIEAYSWLPGGLYGSDSLVAETDLDAYGLGRFTLPCDQYPYGPIVVRIKGYRGNTMIDECHLQL
ncbi:MAG: prepilin-type N-terminal cleavage/methylation domain-containing protein, partial [Synergistaceae bacterium]|nr:prepilin-type N-terminal cleavage/methylation domain-containing protein [Synergistaceae bacterium]